MPHADRAADQFGRRRADQERRRHEPQVKDGTLLAADFKPGQIPGGAAGPQGPQGVIGPAGPKGDTGAQDAQDDPGQQSTEGRHGRSRRHRRNPTEGRSGPGRGRVRDHRRSAKYINVVAAGFNNYGGSYTTAAGEAAAALALTGEAPSWLDAEVFSPTRFTRA